MPTEKLIQAAGSKIDVIINRFTQLTIKDILGIFYRHKLLILLFLIAAYIIYKEQKNIPRVLYALFTVGFFTLLLVRDYDRVTFPLIILWSILLFIQLLKDQKIILLKGFLLIATLVWIIELPIHRYLHNQDNEKLKSEFVYLMNKYPMKYESALGFPRSYGNIGRVLKQNYLFNESQWVSFGQDGSILPSGWIARHPFFYKSHKISSKEERRKYKNYYEFLIDENTGFIGTRTSDPIINSTILKMYDKKYAIQGKCHHAIKILDESEHFSITQIVLKCTK